VARWRGCTLTCYARLLFEMSKKEKQTTTKEEEQAPSQGVASTRLEYRSGVDSFVDDVKHARSMLVARVHRAPKRVQPTVGRNAPRMKIQESLAYRSESRNRSERLLASRYAHTADTTQVATTNTNAYCGRVGCAVEFLARQAPTSTGAARTNTRTRTTQEEYYFPFGPAQIPMVHGAWFFHSQTSTHHARDANERRLIDHVVA
jgi:hypothetical protein